MAHIYLGRLDWNTRKGSPFWEAPGGGSIIDLRTMDQQAAFGGAPQGWAFCAYDAPQHHPLLEVDLGPDIDSGMKQAIRDALEQRIGPIPGSAAASPREAIRLVLLHNGDPAGKSAHKPIYCAPGQRLEIHIGAFGKIHDERIDDLAHKAAQNAIEVFRVDYEHIKSQYHPDTVQRVLGAQMLKMFGRMDQAKVAELLPRFAVDPFKRPDTTITESFNKADSSTVGPELTWTEVVGAWSVVSNQISYDSTSGPDGHIRAEADLSSADHYAQLVITNLRDGADSSFGPSVRFASAATTMYDSWWYQRSDVFITKTVAGSRTNLTSAAASGVAPHTLKLNITGTGLTLYFDGVSKATATDSAISTGVRCGVLGIAGQQLGDSFEASDGISAAGILGKSYIKSQNTMSWLLLR